MKAFLSKYEDDFNRYLRTLKTRMRIIRPEQTGKIAISIPTSLCHTYLEMSPECNIKTRIASLPKYRNKIILKGDKLKIDAQLVEALFDESCSKIIYHMQELFLYPTIKDVTSILLAGSFAESPMFEIALRGAFKNPYREVFVPQGPEIASLNGAVMFGHQPKIINI